MKADRVLAVKSVAAARSSASIFTRYLRPVIQRNRVGRHFQASERSPVRFVFPRGPIEVAYVTTEDYSNRRPTTDRPSSAVATAKEGTSASPTAKDIIRSEGFPRQVFVFQPAVVEVKPNAYQEALGLFGDAGRFAKAAGLKPKEALSFIADVMALGEDAKLEDPDLWIDVIERGKEGALSGLVREQFGIPEDALPGANPKELLNAIVDVQILGGDPSDEGFWEDVIGSGLDGALSGLIRDQNGIPGSAMPGASPRDLLNAIADIQHLNGDPTDPQMFQDLGSMTPEDLIKKYLGVDPGTGEPPSSGGDAGSGSGSSGGSTSSGGSSSGSGEPHGGADDVMDSPGGSSGSSGGSGTGGSTAGGGTSGTGTETSGSSGGGYAPTPGLVLTNEQLQTALETAGTGTGADPASSYARIETDPGSEEGDGDTEGNGDEDESAGSDDESGSEDSSKDDDESPSDGDEGIPDPEKDTRKGKTWDQLSPEEQQEILLVCQALKNSLANPGDPETPLSSTTRTNMNISWRDLLGPYIYPTEEGSSGSSGPQAPAAPGAAVFGPGHILGTLPDPPKL